MNSIWTASSNIQFSNHENMQDHYDICIIGGGLTGLYSALLLAKNGFEVALFEANDHIGENATSFSTGKLTAQHGAIYQKLNSDVREIFYRANMDAIKELADLLPSNVITSCNAYLYSKTEEETTTLKNEFNIYEELRAGCFATNETELPFTVDFAIALKEQYAINPYEALHFIANLAQQQGVKIFTNSRVQHIDEGEQSITAGERSIKYEKLIIATHYPIAAIPSLTVTKLTNYRSYLCATEVSEPLKDYFFKVGNESRTIRTATLNDKHYLLYGGTSHLAGNKEDTERYYQILEQEIQSRFELKNIPYKWSNQDVETFDLLPLIGEISSQHDNIFIATGYRKWGLSQSIVAANILLSSIKKEHTPLQPFVTPSRWKPLRMLEIAGYTVTQFLNSYINRANTPICTHMGCHTRWNDADETWDCPCHGSRFKQDGSILEGPAVEPLDIKGTQ